jgi:hypothetical protein
MAGREGLAMRIIANVFAVCCFLASGAVFIFGAASIGSGPTVFQEIGGICCWIVGSVLLVATVCWIIVDQLERARNERRDLDPAVIAELMRLLEEIKDRGYDTVDRLEKMMRNQ